MPPTPLLGNDVVDLAVAGKAGDARFLGRVFTPAERAWLSRSPQPDLALWRLWAAKEAAYKAWSRGNPALVFAPSRYEVSPGTAQVLGPDGACGVEWQEGPGWVHCLAHDGGARILWRVEALEDVSAESRGVRSLAGRLLAEVGFEGARIVRLETEDPGRWGPPQVVLDGRVLEGVRVSLSHDGRWGAVALAVPGGA